MLDFFVNPDHAGIYTALENGHFEGAGLDVTPRVPSDPAAPIKLVASGQADLAVSYEPEVLLARDQGLDVVAVAAIVPEPLTSLISLPDAGIADPADLRGKTIATAGIPYQDAFLGRILRDARVSPDEVEQVSVGLGLEQAVLSGKADAMLGRFPEHRGRLARGAGREPARRPGRRARDPHLRRARPGRERESRSKRTRRRSASSSPRSSAAPRTQSPIQRPRPTRSSRPATGSTPS